MTIAAHLDCFSCMHFGLCCKVGLVPLDKSMRPEHGFGESIHAYWVLIGDEVA